MLKLILGHGGYTKEKFDNAVAAQVEKLTFNTRDEYLIWVKQWKEEYKQIVTLRRMEKLGRFTLSDKVNAAHKKMEVLEKKNNTSHAIYMAYSKLVNERLHAEIGKSFYHPFGAYWLLIYLLVLRKASKIRAGKKMKENVKV